MIYGNKYNICYVKRLYEYLRIFLGVHLFCLSVNHNPELRCVICNGVTLFALNYTFCTGVLHLNCTNLVLKSLVDEAEGEIWQSKKICFFFWLAAPFDSCPIPSLKIDAVFCGKLSSNSSSNLEMSAVGENEKSIRKDKRRKDLEVICHSGLNNSCNMIVPCYLNPKHVIQPSCRKNLSTSFCVCLVSWKQGNLEIRANIPKSCRKVVYDKIGLYCSESMLGMSTCLSCHIPDRWSRKANWILPDLAFGFVHKRSGNEIRTALLSANQNWVLFSCVLLEV